MLAKQDKFRGKPQYHSRRDGSLEKHLELHDGFRSHALFKGYRHFRMLWDRGYLVPDISVIRIMWNVGREDEHYLVRGKYKITGIQAPAHSGKPGDYDPREVLSGNCPVFEAQSLNPDPKSRR